MPKEEKKKMSKKKKWLIGIGVVLVIGFIGGMGDDEEEPTVAEISEEDQAEIDRRQKEHDEKEAAKKEEEEKKAQEEKEAEEQAAAEEEETEQAEEEETEEVKFKHEVIDGVDVYTDFNNITISPNNYMSNFSIEMTDLLNEVHQDLTNGVVFRNATTLTDGYGNEEKKIVVNVWYSQETVERINYDNWPVLIGEDLYSTADGVIIHFALGQDVDEDNKIASDDAPQFYRYSIGADYEE